MWKMKTATTQPVKISIFHPVGRGIRRGATIAQEHTASNRTKITGDLVTAATVLSTRADRGIGMPVKKSPEAW